MMKPKAKPCKGKGRTEGHGCGKQAIVRKYGLCQTCLKQWALTTEAGAEFIKKHAISHKKRGDDVRKRSWNERKEKMKVQTHSKEHKKYLQIEIQKLARMIDVKFGYNTCIDCGLPFTQGRDRDGGHFHSKGNNPSIRYNLHNIHSQKSNCNTNGLGGGKQHDYYKGLIQRYGQEYADMIDVELQQKYKYIGLTKADYPEKLKTVRAIIRNFETYQFTDAIQARKILNQIIGIHNE